MLAVIRSPLSFWAFTELIHIFPNFCAPSIRPSTHNVLILIDLISHFSDVSFISSFFIFLILLLQIDRIPQWVFYTKSHTKSIKLCISLPYLNFLFKFFRPTQKSLFFSFINQKKYLIITINVTNKGCKNSSANNTYLINFTCIKLLFATVWITPCKINISYFFRNEYGLN